MIIPKTHRIVTWLLPAGFCFMLSACATTKIPTGAITLTPAPIVTQAETFTDNDLSTAIGLAQKAGPQGQQPLQCLQYVKSVVAAANAQTNAPLPVAGVATAATEAYLGLSAIDTATSPVSTTALTSACGPIAMTVRLRGLTLVQQAAALYAMFGIK